MIYPKPRPHQYRNLIQFVNEALGQRDWRVSLILADLWQAPDLPDAVTREENVRELQKPEWKVPTIRGKPATFAAAQALRRDLRTRLEAIAGSKTFRNNSRNGWPVRVFASGELAFDDVAYGLEYLAESLRHEITRGAYQFRGARGRQWAMAKLHLSVCGCGCGKFFLWEGNGTRRRRKYLDDKHRMDFHNARNVERKKQFARQHRSAGDPRYF